MQEIPLLELRGISKSFGGVLAVDDLSLTLSKGEMLGLIGPNGAGKTTVFNIITGIYRPDKGSVLLEGVGITDLKPYKIASLGISRTFQSIRLFKHLTVIENVMSGMHYHTHSGFFSSILQSPKQRKEEKQVYDESCKWLAFMDMTDKASMMASELAYGDQRKLEIVRALASSPKLLILDEPAAGFNETESMQLVEILFKIRDMGITILLIEHDMKVVMTCTDRILVLNFGKLISCGNRDEVCNDKCVIEAYLGHEEE